MGRKLVLTGSKLTDLTAPKLAKIDPLEASGSLLLVEPAHPLTGTLGALANGLTVPNLFAANAAALTSGSAANMHAALAVSSGLSGKMLLERTGKGGIHGIVTQVDGQITSGLGVALNPSAQLRGYAGFAKATGHQFYVSFWFRPTRLPATQDVVDLLFGVAANDYMYFRSQKTSMGTGTPASGQTILLDTFGNTAETLATTRRSARFDAAATLNAFTPGMLGPAWGSPAGSYSEAAGTTHRDDSPSFVFYRLYIEDLTVSGRTYATVDVLDAALYAARFGVGGQYADDTFTSPSTLP